MTHYTMCNIDVMLKQLLTDATSFIVFLSQQTNVSRSDEDGTVCKYH